MVNENQHKSVALPKRVTRRQPAERHPVMLGWPFSRWPVNRGDQELSLLTVTVTSYQPLAVSNSWGISSCLAN
jgi:hypothetical protein